MSHKGEQRRGSCGHLVALWDTHPSCISCTKCIKDSPCEYCSSWPEAIWIKAGARRTHKSRKTKKIPVKVSLSSTSEAEFDGFSQSDSAAKESDQKVRTIKSLFTTAPPSASAGSSRDTGERMLASGVSSAERKLPTLGVRADPSGDAIGHYKGNLVDWPLLTPRSAGKHSSESSRVPNFVSGQNLETGDRAVEILPTPSQPGIASEQNPYDTGQPVTHYAVARQVTGKPGSHGDMTRPGAAQSFNYDVTGQPVRQLNMIPVIGNSVDNGIGQSFTKDWSNQMISHPSMTRPGTSHPGTTGQPGTGQMAPVCHDRIDTRYHSFAAQPEYMDVQNTGQYVPGSYIQTPNSGYRDYQTEKYYRSPRETVYYSRENSPPLHHAPLHKVERLYDRQGNQAYRDTKFPDLENLRLPERHLSRQSLERRTPVQDNYTYPIKGRSRPSHTVSSAPTIDTVRPLSAAERRAISQDRHQNIESEESMSDSEIDQPVERPVRGNLSRRRVRQDSSSSSNEELESQHTTMDEPAVERWSLQQAIEEVFRVVPSTFCPKVDAPPRRKNLSSLEELNAETTTPQQLLPQANNLGRLLDQLQSTRSLVTIEPAWSVPLAISKEWVSPKVYVASKEFFPVKVPTLDGDAATLGLSAPTSITVNAKLIERWEARARLGVMVSSHDDHFAIALAMLLKEENVSSRGASRILEAFDTGNRHLMALNLQNATEMLSVRRDATLIKSSPLLQTSKDSLRAAPLASNLLFGGRVAAVTVSDASEQSRRLSASAANAFSQSNKHSAPSAKWGKPRKPPAKKQKQEVKALPPKQPPSTGQKFVKPKPRYTGAKPKQTSRYGTAPRPQP